MGLDLGAPPPPPPHPPGPGPFPCTAAYLQALHGRGSLGLCCWGKHVVRQLATPLRPNIPVLSGLAPPA